ncbi:MAG: T9SS type A sorting domain-containing protein [Bacteroidales bacterium]
MKKLYIITLLSILFVGQIKAQWTNLNALGSNYEDYQLLAVSDNGKNIAAYNSKLTSGQSTIHYTTSHDYGITWQVYLTTQATGGQYMFWDGDNLYIQTSNATIANLKKSTDYGASFTVQNSSYNTQSLIIRSANAKWYIVNSSLLYSSIDKGASWTSVSNLNNVFIDYVVANNGNIVATCNSGVIYSTNGGDSWTVSTFPNSTFLKPYNSISKASDGSLLVFHSSSSLVCKSTDNGVTWQQINSTLPANTKSLLYSGTDIISYSILGTTYKSTDGGLLFTQMTPSSLLTTVSSMTAANNNVYIYGMSAIYKYGNSSTGIAEQLSDKKITVFPNPCKDFVEVKSDKVFDSYQIINLLGEVVVESKFIDGKIDISSMISGVYLLNCIEKNGTRTSLSLVKE